jgi:hypothetical protein
MSAMTVPVQSASHNGNQLALSEVLAAAPSGQEPAPGFTACLEGVPYRVTAVLDRTATLEVPGDRWAERRTARFDQLRVDPASISWRPKASRTAWLERGRARGRAKSRRRADSDRTGEPRPEGGSQRAAAGPATAEPAEVVESPAEAAPPLAAAAAELGASDEAGPRDCLRCGRRLRSDNRSGICTPCQSVCPTCGGAKSVTADHCRRCRSAAGDPLGDHGLGDRDLSELPVLVEDLLDRFVRMARHARDLEEELERRRAVEARMRELGRRVEAAIAEQQRDGDGRALSQGAGHRDGDEGRQSG